MRPWLHSALNLALCAAIVGSVADAQGTPPARTAKPGASPRTPAATKPPVAPKRADSTLKAVAPAAATIAPAPLDVDGDWKGTTANGRDVALTISQGVVVMVRLDYSIPTNGCFVVPELNSNVQVDWSPSSQYAPHVRANRLSITRSWNDRNPAINAEMLAIVEGEFTSRSTFSGQAEYEAIGRNCIARGKQAVSMTRVGGGTEAGRPAGTAAATTPVSTQRVNAPPVTARPVTAEPPAARPSAAQPVAAPPTARQSATGQPLSAEPRLTDEESWKLHPNLTGRWEGTSADGQKLTFVVDYNDVLTDLQVDFALNTTGCLPVPELRGRTYGTFSVRPMDSFQTSVFMAGRVVAGPMMDPTGLDYAAGARITSRNAGEGFIEFSWSLPNRGSETRAACPIFARRTFVMKRVR